jgi:hypothetical protein
MARRSRTWQPPSTGNPEFDSWFRTFTENFNALPNFSIISTSDGPESNVTADSGVIAIDVGSSNTTLWFKAAGIGTTGWSTVTLI